MNIKIFLLTILIIFSKYTNAGTVFSSNGTGGGDWTLASSWTRVSGDMASVPDEDDIVTILANDVITISTLSSSNWERFEDLTINIDGAIQINSGCKLRGWGSGSTAILANNGSITGSGEIVSDVTTTISGNGTYSSSTNFWVYGTMSFSSMNTIIAGDVKIQGVLNIETTSDVEISGNIYATFTNKQLNNKGTLRISTSSFFTSGNGSTQQVFYCDYSGSTFIYNQSGALPLPVGKQFVNLTNTGALTSNEDFNIKGDWDNSGSFSSTVSGNNIIFNGISNQEIKGGGTYSFNKLTLSNSSNSNTLTLSSSDITIHQAMESTSGIFSQSGANIILETSSSNNETGIVKVASTSNYSYSSGNFTAKRYFNGSANSWRMISSPIKNATLNEINSQFIFCGIDPVPSGQNYAASSCGGFHNVITYDNNGPSWNNITSISQSISGGTGTMIYGGTDPVTISITGEPNFANTPVTISSGGDQFNLVSNPYPTTIDWTAFSAANNSKITSSGYYIYDEGSGGFVSRSADISSHQGFFVKAIGSGDLNFNVNTTINEYDQAFQRSTNGVNNPLKLTLTSNVNSYHDFAYLISGPGYSNNYDSSHELEEFFPTSQTFDYAPSLFFVVDDSNYIDRNCINNNQSADILFDVRIGKFAHGNYTLNFSDLTQFMIGSCIHLEDLQNGIITDLRLDSSYSFFTDSLSPSPRFKLQILVDYDINVTNSSCYQNNSASVSLSGDSLSGNYFNLIDNSGFIIDSIYTYQDYILFDALNAGEYSLLTSHSGSCSLHGQEIIITEPDEVISSFTSYNDTLFLDTNGMVSTNFQNTSSGATNFLWDFGDGNFSNDINPSHTFNNHGSFIVKLKADNDSLGLCSHSFEKIITVNNPFLGFDNNFINSQINLYADEYFLNIKISTNLNSLDYYNVYDSRGKKVFEGSIFNPNIKIDISEINSGIYFLLINNKTGKNIIRKFFKP